MLGCGWTVYSNILSAGVYPTISEAGYGEQVAKTAPTETSRNVTHAINTAFAALPVPVPARATAEAAAPSAPSQTATIEFGDRFAASEPTSVPSRAETVGEAKKPKSAAPEKVASSPPTDAKPLAKSDGVTPADMAARAKAAMLSIPSGGKQSMVEKLWGKPAESQGLLAFASADASIPVPVEHTQNPSNGGSPPYDRDTAVYDISAHTVYLPDGTTLEAHSGLGSDKDDPKSAPVHMKGVTPPHIYDLSLRESPFHGVDAIRLNPIGGEDAIYGRDGLLAHTYMLKDSGASNGCVVFRDYKSFLNAYKNMGVKKLAVVAKIS